MRISSSLFFQTGLNSINAQQSDLLHLYQQIGSGQRMVTPSDDPLAAAQAVNISQAQSLNQRFADNRDVAKRNLGTEENVLTSVTGLLQDVKTRLVEAGNGTMSDADRNTLATVLSNARESLLGLANSTDGSGQYLFSGSKGGVAPYQNESGKIVYKGDGVQRLIQADRTRTIAGSDVGSDIFARATPGTTQYLTRALDANTGTGVIGAPQITDPDGTHAGSSLSIVFGADGAYTVTVDGDPANTFTGTIEPGKANTIGLGGVQVKFSGTPQAGDTFEVKPAASSGDEVDLFATLDGMIAALKAPSGGNDVAAAKLQNQLASAMQRVGISYDNVLTVRASVGARLNELEALDANGSQRGLSYTQQLSKLEDLDYYTATTQLQLRNSALQAASLAFRQIQSMGLFNMGSK